VTTDLVTVRDLQGDQTDDAVYPAITADLQCRLAPGETMLWHGTATVSCLQEGGKSLEQVWELPACDVLVTNQRLVYLCPNFTKGSTAWGFGPLGIAVALIVMAVSHLRAANRRRGRVATGQVRFQWPTGLTVESRTAFTGAVDTYVVLRCEQANSGPLYLRLWSSSYDAMQLAPFLVSRIAQFRLDFPYLQPLTEAQLDKLKEQAVQPASRSQSPGGDPRRQQLTYHLPAGRKVPHLGH
jgi:hypothetical protein